MFKNKDLVRLFGLHDIPVNTLSCDTGRVDFPITVRRALGLSDG